MTEAELQTVVLELAGLLGWRVAHFRPAQTGRGWRTPMQGHVGFPDLVCARNGRVLFLELKADRGRLSGEQVAWSRALGGHASVVRPSDWLDGTVERLLR